MKLLQKNIIMFMAVAALSFSSVEAVDGGTFLGVVKAPSKVKQLLSRIVNFLCCVRKPSKPQPVVVVKTQKPEVVTELQQTEIDLQPVVVVKTQKPEVVTELQPKPQPVVIVETQKPEVVTELQPKPQPVVIEGQNPKTEFQSNSRIVNIYNKRYEIPETLQLSEYNFVKSKHCTHINLMCVENEPSLVIGQMQNGEFRVIIFDDNKKYCGESHVTNFIWNPKTNQTIYSPVPNPWS